LDICEVSVTCPHGCGAGGIPTDSLRAHLDMECPLHPVHDISLHFTWAHFTSHGHTSQLFTYDQMSSASLDLTSLKHNSNLSKIFLPRYLSICLDFMSLWSHWMCRFMPKPNAAGRTNHPPRIPRCFDHGDLRNCTRIVHTEVRPLYILCKIDYESAFYFYVFGVCISVARVCCKCVACK
jgi:hypothetical protein